MNKLKIIFFILIISVYSCANKQLIPPNSIPITYADYIFIKGEIDDTVTANLLLDTGADNLYIDSFFYAQNDFKHPNLGTVEVEGIGNSIQTIKLIKDSLKFSFSEYNYKTSYVPILELKPIGGDFIDGLFGLSYFEKDILEINYTKSYIAKYNNIDTLLYPNNKKYSKIKMKQVEHFFCIPLSFNLNDTLTIKGDFFIDVGLPITIITASAAQKHKLSENVSEKVQYYTKYGGVGGESAGYDFIAQSLKIGDYSLDKINMSYSLDEGGLLSEGKYIGILGNNILEKFDLVFDFNTQYFYIKPNQQYYKKFEFDKLGFTYVDRTKTKGGWIITGITKESEASKKINIDDKILEVNGTPVKHISLQEQSTYFDHLNQVELLIQTDTIMQIVTLNLTPLL